MLVYPQLSTGALAQYPLTKQRSERTILNIAQDGTVTALWDPYASQIRWQLTYQDLTDTEAAELTSFFQACEGPLQPFLFVDPTANLIQYSEDPGGPAWVLNSLMTVASGIDDPFGGTSASRLSNTAEAALAMTQTVQMAGSYRCTFSVYLRCSQTVNGIELGEGDGNNSASLAVTPGASWNRFTFSNAFASSISQNCEFSLTVPAGAQVDVFGFQVDAQPSAGIYVTTTSGVNTYPAARFERDTMTVVSTGPSRNNIQVSILSQVGN